MTFENALSHAKSGVTIKRGDWTNKSVTYDEDSDTYRVTITTTIEATYIPTGTDMAKEDWVVVTE